MTKEQLYDKLEHEFELIHDNYDNMKMFQTDEEEIGQIARFENILLEGDLSFLMKYWTDDVRDAIRTYSEKRYEETNNIHLKAKYGWGLWAIGGKKDYQLLSKTLDLIQDILETYINENDIVHASTFCHYYKRIYPHCLKIGKTERILALIEKVMLSKNETLKFHALGMVYHQEREDELIREKWEGYENKEQIHYLKKMDAHMLAKTCLGLAEKETVDPKYEQLIKWAVLFVEGTNDGSMKKEAFEKLGDYKMTHLFPEQEGNLAPPHQNDFLLREAMHC